MGWDGMGWGWSLQPSGEAVLDAVTCKGIKTPNPRLMIETGIIGTVRSTE